MRNTEYGIAMPGLFIPQSAIRTLNLTYVLSSNSPKIPAAALQRRGGAGACHSDAQQRHRAKPHRARVSVLRSARHREDDYRPHFCQMLERYGRTEGQV